MATSDPIGQKPSTNPYIDSLLWKGSWDQSSGPITYAFLEPKDTWTADEKKAMRAALDSWRAVANIKLKEVSDAGSANLDFYVTRGATGNFGRQLGPIGNTPKATEGLGRYYPDAHPDWEENLDVGGFSYYTLVHELGHGFGLSHPFPDNSKTSSLPGVTEFTDPGTFGLNSGLYTVMSYNYRKEAWGPQSAQDYGFVGGPMALDIAAMQHIYGKNTTTGAGQNVYTLPGVNAAGTYYSCIWDAKGIDEISYRGKLDAVIDLRAAPLEGENAGGYLSRAKGILGGFTIANGVVIERASGGDGNDTITGNDANNTLDGFNGDDTLGGGRGNDLIDGGFGFDKMDGGAGEDTVTYAFYVGSTGMVVDLMKGKTTFRNETRFDTLTNIENVVGGGGADVILGNLADNELEGDLGNDVLSGNSGKDVLIGGLGADILTGGSDADTFVYRTFSHSSGGFMDHITDFRAGVDRLDVSSVNIRAGLRSMSFSSTFTDEIFKDIGTAKANEMLLLNVSGTKAGTYLFINDNTAAVDWTKDILINLTGISGRLDIDDFI